MTKKTIITILLFTIQIHFIICQSKKDTLEIIKNNILRNIDDWKEHINTSNYLEIIDYTNIEKKDTLNKYFLSDPRFVATAKYNPDKIKSEYLKYRKDTFKIFLNSFLFQIEDPINRHLLMPKDCNNKIYLNYDEIEGTKSWVNKFPIKFSETNQKYALSVSSLMTEDEIIGLTFYLKGGKKCSKKGDEIIFLFTDGTRSIFNNTTEFSCDGESLVIFFHFINKDSLRLRYKKIKKIRIYYLDDYLDFVPSIGNKIELSEILNCLISKSNN